MKIGVRRKSRELAMQALFFMDMVREESSHNLDIFCDHFSTDKKAIPFARELVSGVIKSRDKLDATIEQFSNNWKIYRMPHVDRNILRIATFEMLYCSDIPLKVSINEAIDVAKKFGTHESGPFINGILDSLRVALEKNDVRVKALDDKDEIERRCPRLGGPVPFKYCMSSGDDNKPCFKIMDCWWETFDIQSYLKSRLTQEDYAALMGKKAPDKIASLLDLIEQAKKTKKS